MAAPKRRLSKLGLDFPFMVAPMVGITNLAFRELLRSYTPRGLTALLFTEMLSSRRLPNSPLNRIGEVRFRPEVEKELVVQLLANEDEFLALSMKKLREAEPWGVDINMGCPVSHTLRYNWGVRLMGDVDYAAKVVELARAHCPWPLSVKLRASPGDHLDFVYLEKFSRKLEEAGADWLTIHARTKAQKHKGPAQHGFVAEVAKHRKIPEVVNGGVQNATEAKELYERATSIDGVMLGRAAVVRPWILWQIAEDFGYSEKPPAACQESSTKAPRSPEEEGREYLRACQALLSNYARFYADESFRLKQFRFFVGHSVRWFPFGHSFWRESKKAKTFVELCERVHDFGEKFGLTMYPRLENA